MKPSTFLAIVLLFAFALGFAPECHRLLAAALGAITLAQYLAEQRRAGVARQKLWRESANSLRNMRERSNDIDARLRKLSAKVDGRAK